MYRMQGTLYHVRVCRVQLSPGLSSPTAGAQQFTDDKLRSGILRALEKRPVAMEKVEIAISRIRHKLRSLGEREVKSRKVGDWVMEELKSVDQVAYLRFASVYQSFADVRAFLEEIERLEDEVPAELKEAQMDLLGE